MVHAAYVVWFVFAAISGIWTLVFGTMRTQKWIFFYDMSDWVTTTGTLTSCLMLLSVCIRAANWICSRRKSVDLDLLPATPIDNDAILRHRFWSCVSGMRIGLVFLAMIWAVGWFSHVLFVVDILILLIVLFIYASGMILLGIWCSVTHQTGVRATMSALCMVAVLSIGHCILSATSFSQACSRSSLLGDDWPAITPLHVIAHFHCGEIELQRHNGGQKDASRHLSRTGEFLALAVIFVLYSLVSACFWHFALIPRFRQLSGRIVGKRPKPVTTFSARM